MVSWGMLFSKFAALLLGITIVCNGSVGEELQKAEGKVIYLTEGDCFTDRHIEYCSPTDLIGEGETRTKLTVVGGISGVSFLRGDRCKGRGIGGSTRNTLTRLSLISPGIVYTSTPTFGVELRANTVVDRVSTQGFVHGFDVYGNIVKDGTHANYFDLRRITATGAMHAGVWIQGPDTNVGTVIGVTASSNCREAGKWNGYFDVKRSVEMNELGEAVGRYQKDVCAGYFNRSQYGTADMAIAGSLNRDRITGIWYPAHWYEGTQNASALWGGYKEGTAIVPRSHFDQMTVAIGGFVAFEGSGFQLLGFRANRLLITNASDPLYPVTLTLGDLAGKRTFMRFDGPDVLPDGTKMTSLGFKLDPLRLQFLWDLNNQTRVEWILLKTGVSGMKTQ